MPRKRDTKAIAAPQDRPPRPPRPAIGLPLLPDGRYELPGGNPCEGCDHCCRYIAMSIPNPRTKRHFEEIRWYVLHEGVSVYIDWEGDWGIEFRTNCTWLKDGRCTHYALRPHLCSDYDPAECERYVTSPSEKILIRNEQDLDRYLARREERLRKRKARRAAATSGLKVAASGARAAAREPRLRRARVAGE